MTVSFDDFRQTLSQEQRLILDKILEEETRERRRTLLENIITDQNHLEILNFCANFFTPGQLLPEKTGYSLTLVEPLYTLGIRSFDLGIFRKENESLILTECKSSVSNVKELISDLSETIRQTNERKKDLEGVLGNSIADPIEFALCVPATSADGVGREILNTQTPICVWAAGLWEKKMSLFTPSEETKISIEAGRLHRDGNLNSILGHGVESTLRAIYSVPILPSLHMCNLLLYVSELIYGQTKAYGKYAEFQYSDVFSILVREMGRLTSLSDDNFESLATNICRTGLRKGIFKDLTDDVSELPRKMFQISGRKTNAEAVRRSVKDTYVEHNALEKAKSEAIPRYKKERGITTINSYMTNNQNFNEL
jgi:hypothetical protein